MIVQKRGEKCFICGTGFLPETCPSSPSDHTMDGKGEGDRVTGNEASLNRTNADYFWPRVLS